MNAEAFWNIMVNAQLSTALLLIAASLVYIAFKLSERNGKAPRARKAEA